ncbi:hypothetical protein E4U58_001846 [Claviceps cyperi]|nr:hypothetical protein E4U58_001846 [Claviceps cyperi]
MDSTQDEFTTAESAVPDEGLPQSQLPTPLHAVKENLPRKLQRFYQRISPNWTNFDAPWDPKTTTKQQRTDWMANRLKAYVDQNLRGRDLYIAFREDFEDWNLDAFTRSDSDVRREMRNHLQTNGVDLNNNNGFTSITAIAKILWILISEGHSDFEANEPSWSPRVRNPVPMVAQQAVEDARRTEAMRSANLDIVKATSPGRTYAYHPSAGNSIDSRSSPNDIEMPDATRNNAPSNYIMSGIINPATMHHTADEYVMSGALHPGPRTNQDGGTVRHPIPTTIWSANKPHIRSPQDVEMNDAPLPVNDIPQFVNRLRDRRILNDMTTEDPKSKQAKNGFNDQTSI